MVLFQKCVWRFDPSINFFFLILILFVLNFKNYKRQMLSLNCKYVHHVEVYLPCNFEVNLISHLGVLALFSSNLKRKLILFVLYFKNYLEIKVKFKSHKCSVCQDLPTLQFGSKFHYPFWSYCPFFIKMLSILILSSYISKTIRDRGKV